MQFGHGTQSDDVTNRPKALFVVGHCMLSHWFTSSLHTITLYRHTDPTGRPVTPHDTPRAGTMLLSEADYPPLCLVQPPPHSPLSISTRVDKIGYRMKNRDFQLNAIKSPGSTITRMNEHYAVMWYYCNIFKLLTLRVRKKYQVSTKILVKYNAVNKLKF